MGKAAHIHSHPLGGGRDLVSSAQHQLLIQLGFGIMIAEFFKKSKQSIVYNLEYLQHKMNRSVSMIGQNGPILPLFDLFRRRE